ncbi:MAG: hypothetical protein AAF481_01640 [Acidobacteriota bacterium]
MKNSGVSPSFNRLTVAAGLALWLGLSVACGGVSRAAPRADESESASSNPPSEASVAQQAAALDDCEAVAMSYGELMEEQSACSADEDCHVVAGDCAVGLGGCYYAVSVEVTEAVKRPLVDRFRDLECSGGVCRCAAPPESAVCEAGRCVTP